MGTFDQKKYQDFDPSDGAARYPRCNDSNCIMGHGHGAVTIGSEMSGGVYDVDCQGLPFQGQSVVYGSRRAVGAEPPVSSTTYLYTMSEWSTLTHR